MRVCNLGPINLCVSLLISSMREEWNTILNYLLICLIYDRGYSQMWQSRYSRVTMQIAVFTSSLHCEKSLSYSTNMIVWRILALNGQLMTLLLWYEPCDTFWISDSIKIFNFSVCIRACSFSMETICMSLNVIYSYWWLYVIHTT